MLVVWPSGTATCRANHLMDVLLGWPINQVAIYRKGARNNYGFCKARVRVIFVDKYVQIILWGGHGVRWKVWSTTSEH